MFFCGPKLEKEVCTCWNEAVDFLAIPLLIRGCSSSAGSLEIGLFSKSPFAGSDKNLGLQKKRETPTVKANESLLHHSLLYGFPSS